MMALWGGPGIVCASHCKITVKIPPVLFLLLQVKISAMKKHLFVHKNLHMTLIKSDTEALQ